MIAPLDSVLLVFRFRYRAIAMFCGNNLAPMAAGRKSSVINRC
jgi:hypothetical protein